MILFPVKYSVLSLCSPLPLSLIFCHYFWKLWLNEHHIFPHSNAYLDFLVDGRWGIRRHQIIEYIKIKPVYENNIIFKSFKKIVNPLVLYKINTRISSFIALVFIRHFYTLLKVLNYNPLSLIDCRKTKYWHLVCLLLLFYWCYMNQ